jgi:S1-C subfamily serine protease
MARGLWRCGVAAMALAAGLTLGASEVRAEQWLLSGASTKGDLYEIDLDTISRTGAVARTWLRQTLAKPAKNPVNGKSYVVIIVQQYLDCQNRRSGVSELIYRDRQGRVISSTSGAVSWQDVVPGSVTESLWRIACRASEPPPEKPLLDNILDGQWLSIGLSTDKKYSMSVKLDQVQKVGDGGAYFLSRFDYIGFDVVHGFPIKHVVIANLMDCRQSKTAELGYDSYMSRTVRAESYRAPDNEISLRSIPPGSFLANSQQPICAAAATSAKDSDGQPGQTGGVGVGTAWVGDKGYLVTASHVIEGGKSIEVYSDGEKVGRAKVVADDPANDVAILKFVPERPMTLRALALAPHGAALGRSVFTLGYPAPDVLGQQVKMTAGQVSSTAGIEDDARFLQISVPIQPGNSGGPIIAWDGSVVGVVDAKLRRLSDDPESKEAPPENVNYAVKASYVRAMLEDLPDLGGYTYVKGTAGHDELVAAARRAVFMLVVTQ